jgi:high-affinity iron transporter
MPEVCSPEVSPAVVVLEPVGGPGRVATAAPTAAAPAEVVLVRQRGLQFVPRVQAVALGRAVRFTNDDAETHNVHVISTGDNLNVSMAPGQPLDFTPTRPGVVRVVCDIHSHMRGYVVVGASPWVQVCTAKGRFRLDSVPDGSYRLTVWHEMGDPLRKEVTVAGGKALDLGTLALTASPPAPLAPGQAEPVRAWAEVVDRIGMRLAAALAAAGKGGDFKAARKQAEDAYWGEFEASDMETAVRLHLGFARATELEQRFRAVVPALRNLAGRQGGAEPVVDATRQLLLALVKVSDDLNRKGVTDAAHLRATDRPAQATFEPAPAGDHAAMLAALGRGLDGIRDLADRDEADEAASAMNDVYFEEFEPLERFIGAHRPTEVRPLESRFNTLRGRVGAGLKGAELADALGGLRAEVKAALGRSEDRGAGTFGTAFAASLITIVREGMEVILLLTMLVALATRAGQAGALRAIAWGVGLAVLASAATAVGLNLMVASAQGRTREVVEGGVMLAAAGLLFYVSYWLISQSESKRWTDFLKRQAARGASPGGGLALLATAFLAVYREGAETALMYQALIGAQDGSRAGLTGLAAGLGLGLVALAAIAYAVRATSVRLPLRAFFQATGVVLFAMAVVFAGNGVFELQSSGVLKVTPLTWLGPGLPALGLHPNLQALSVQALLLAGAAMAGVVLLMDEGWGEKKLVRR